ncbi:hypothetical protein FIBSPDRAFT_1039264 [Athelia psychrophila]|uniref:Uncharacterized protein n=1 Tax=Athelia psychrophila TaxID=1759441 RepID=A0A166S1I0_9AGAM|nr:hypothetical protein FIBSPDRAFT_1039264 [Fibularhizoctonia sp. CBS 109695]
MSGYYSSPPSSPTFGLFPQGPASPHAFASFGQNPREQHAIQQQSGAQSGGQSGGRFFASLRGKK